MWTYKQSNGELRHNNTLIGIGYAGNDEYKNDPKSQSVINHGPLPTGYYIIGPAYDSSHTGPMSFNLIPDTDNDMFGRSSFKIHPDAIEHPGKASDGCIVQNKTVRLMVKNSPDRILQVIS